jgi:hypothetical protein
MSDENIQEDHPEFVPKATPKPERDPIVIEGEAKDLTPPEPATVEPETIAEEPTAHAASTEPEVAASADGEASEPVVEAAPPSASAANTAASPPPPAAEPPRSSGFGAAKTLGLVVIVAAAALAGAYVAPLLTGDKAANDEHLAAIDGVLKSETAARQALEARIVKLEGAIAGAQTLAAASAAKIAAPAPTAPASATPTPVVVAAPPPAAPATPDPEVAKLASGASALADRIAKLESALAAQKSEARAEPLAKVKALDPVAEAVAAISLAQRLAEGEPYAAEFDALSKSGADAGALAALKPYADAGAPTPGKLAAAFAKLTPAITAPAKTTGQGEIVEQVVDKLRGLVKVHAVGEVQGDDPAALASQISAALARGDVAAALATEAKLPQAARAAAAGWAKDAAGLESATAAARSLAETALKRFADAKS